MVPRTADKTLSGHVVGGHIRPSFNKIGLFLLSFTFGTVDASLGLQACDFATACLGH